MPTQKPLDERIKAAKERADKAAARLNKLEVAQKHKAKAERYKASQALITAVLAQAAETEAFRQVLVDVADARLKAPEAELVKGLLAGLESVKAGARPDEPSVQNSEAG